MTKEPDEPTAIFEGARPRLWGLAYRMLGSAADAEDAVQDVYVKWMTSRPAKLEAPVAWLTTICTRRCLDMLRAAHRTRIEYPGPWLPEPVTEDSIGEASGHMELIESLSTAFLLLLERLTPSERAAYLLREIFEYDYEELSGALAKSPEACRQLVSRAKKHLGARQVRFTAPPARQDRLLDSFLSAMTEGALDQFAALLSDDVELWADGGGKSASPRRIVHGPRDVAKFFVGVWRKAWHELSIESATVNGTPGLLLRERHMVVGALAFDVLDDGRIRGAYLVRNPDKLRLLNRSPSTTHE